MANEFQGVGVEPIPLEAGFDRQKLAKEDVLHSQRRAILIRCAAVEDKTTTGRMSAHIEPRKKALGWNPQPILIGSTLWLALLCGLGSADCCEAQSAPPVSSVSSPMAEEATRADASPADARVNTDAPPPAATAPRTKSHLTAHRTPAQVMDVNVHRLAQALNLDQEQQAKLRQILLEQNAQLMKLRTDSAPGTDLAGAMHAIVDRTRERIRGILNEEQKKQYAAQVPHEISAATRADLQHWLEVRDAQRNGDTEESK